MLPISWSFNRILFLADNVIHKKFCPRNRKEKVLSPRPQRNKLLIQFIKENPQFKMMNWGFYNMLN
jgi:hypothetical protein